MAAKLENTGFRAQALEWLLPCFILLLAFWSYYTSPIQLTFNAKPVEEAEAKAFGKIESVYSVRTNTGVSVPLWSIPATEACEIKITHAKSDLGGSIELLRTTTSRRGTIDPQKYKVRRGNWHLAGGSWQSTQTGSNLFWQGNCSGLKLEFAAGPNAGKVRIRWNGKTQILDLRAATRASHFVELSTKTRTLYASLPSNTQSFDIENLAKLSNYSLIAKGQALNSTTSLIDNGIEVSITNATSKGSQVFSFGKNLLALMLPILLLGLLYYAAGRLLVQPFASHLKALEVPIISWISGFCFLVSIGCALSYANLPLNYMLYSAGLLGILWGLLLALRPSFTLSILKSDIHALWTMRKLLLAALALVAFLFAPALSEREWYLGQVFTDTFWYINVAEMLREVGAYDYDTNLWSFQRISDLVSVANAAIFGHSDCREAYINTIVSLTFILPLVAYAILQRSACKSDLCFIGAVLAGTSAAFYSHFTQCYFAHFLFLHGLFYSLLFCWIFFDEISRMTHVGRYMFLFSMALAFSLPISAYPYQFFVPLCLAIASFAAKRELRATYVTNTIILGLLCLITCHLSLQIVLNFGSNAYLMESLNAIARNIVFPFYNTGLMLPIAFGITDFNRNSTFAAELGSEISMALSWVLATDWVFYLGVVFFALCLYGFTYSFKADRSKGIFLTSLFGLWLLIALKLFLDDQAYPFGKLVMTTGAVSAIPLAIALQGLGRTAIVYPIALLCLLLNLNANHWENAPWQLNRYSPVLDVMRTHLRALEPELQSAVSKVDADDFETGTVLVLGDLQDLMHTDTDRTHYWILRHTFRKLEMLSNERLPIGNYGMNYAFHQSRATIKSHLNSEDLRYIVQMHGTKIPKGPKLKEIARLRAYSILRVQN